MSTTLRRLALIGGALFVLSFVVVMVNQTAQVVQLARTVHPIFGHVVLWTPLAGYLALVLVPLLLVFRLPAPLAPPASVDAPEFPQHLAALRQRLIKNAHISQLPLNSVEEVQAALTLVDAKANQIAQQTASSVFVSTERGVPRRPGFGILAPGPVPTGGVGSRLEDAPGRTVRTPDRPAGRISTARDARQPSDLGCHDGEGTVDPRR